MTVKEAIESPETSPELREALEHNVAVRAISPSHSLEEARELLAFREMAAAYSRARARRMQ